MSFDLLDFSFPLLDRLFIYLLQVFFKSYLFLHPVLLRLVVLSEYYLYLIFKDILRPPLALRLILGPHEQQLQGIFHGHSVVTLLTIHQKLSEVEEFFGLCCSFVHHALFIHGDELLLADPLIEVFIELPDHELDLRLCHFHFHLFEDFSNLLSPEGLSTFCELLEYLKQVLLLCLIDRELIHFLLQGLLLINLPLLELLGIELELLEGALVLFLEYDGVPVFLLQLFGQVLQSQGLRLTFFGH